MIAGQTISTIDFWADSQGREWRGIRGKRRRLADGQSVMLPRDALVVCVTIVNQCASDTFMVKKKIGAEAT